MIPALRPNDSQEPVETNSLGSVPSMADKPLVSSSHVADIQASSIRPTWIWGLALVAVTGAHVGGLIGVGYVKPEPPPSIDTIELTFVAQGDPVPEATKAQDSQPATDPTPPEPTPPPPPVEEPTPPPPAKAVEEAVPIEALPPPPPQATIPPPPPETPLPRVEPPKPVEKPKPKTPPKPPAKEKHVEQQASEAHKVGVAGGKAAVDAGMTKEAYSAIISAQINQHRVYPEAARSKNITGHVVVSFTITASGTASAITITQSSGNPLLDDAARQAVGAVHAPPPPGGVFAGSKSFTFKLD